MGEKVALVTGVSSGIGQAVASGLTKAGYRVFGSVRSGRPPEGVESVLLDVRDPVSIEAAVAGILEKAGRVDVLVNNAGGTLVGAIEETDTAQAQALFDVNFFGAVRATQAVLPAMRAQRSGRIIFVSSVVGFLPAPFMGFYAASKHAIEGYSESLDHEIRGFGVRALLVQPGFVRTHIDQNASRANRHLDAYAALGQRVGDSFSASIEKGDDPQVVARMVVSAAEAKKPRLRYPVGRNAAAVSRLRRFVPASLFDRPLRKEFGLD